MAEDQDGTQKIINNKSDRNSQLTTHEIKKKSAKIWHKLTRQANQPFKKVEKPNPENPETKEKKYEYFYKTINKKLSRFEVNAIDEFGTPGGADLDLRLYFDEIPDEGKRQEIKEIINSYGLETHVFFSKQSDWEAGKLFETDEKARPIVEYTTDGVNLHDVDVLLSDYSLLQLYLASTSRTILKNGARVQSEISRKALENIILTSEGGADFAHLYTGDFLHDYINTQKREGESNKDYTKRVSKKRAKTLIRVTLGNIVASSSPDDLTNIKDDIHKYLNDNEKGDSMDERLARFITENYEKEFDFELIKNIYFAGLIRSGKTPPEDDDFVGNAEGQIFYLAFQQGMDQRIKEGQNTHDTLSAYALTRLFENLSSKNEEKYKGDIERVTIKPKEIIIPAGEENDYLYILPVRKNDKSPNTILEVEVPGSEKKIDLQAGRIAGIGVFAPDNLKKTATVSAKDEDVEVIKVSGEFMRSLLTNGDIFNELTNPDIPTSSPEAKALDVFLRMSAFEMTARLNTYAGFTTPPHEVETSEIIERGNALSAYHQPKRIISIIEKRYEGERSFPDQEIYIEKISAKDDNIEIFSKGDPQNNKLYVVKSGSVRIVGIGPDGKDLVLPAGSLFGESRLAGTKTRGAPAIADKDSEIYEVDMTWFVEHGNLYNPTLFYHLAALNFGRLKNRLVRNTPTHNS